MSDLVTTKPGAVSAPPVSVFDCAPNEMLARVTKVADALNDVIKQQNFAVQIGNGKHLKVEGWSTLGMMMGFMPREKSVVAHDDGSFTATVEIVNMSNDQIIGAGSSICGDKTDGHWSKKPAHARRAMAITRATGRAYRLGMSWIVTLAGYQPTPAEEMEKFEVFDMANQEDLNRLTSYLKQRKVDKKEWPRMELLMHGRPSTKETIEDCINLLVPTGVISEDT